MLVIRAVAFCPHPPVLVPEVAQGAAHELEDLRAACRTAIRATMTPDVRPLILGSGPTATRYGATVRGSLAAHGVPLEVPLGSDAPGPIGLPLSLTVGAWLLRDALGPDNGALGCTVAADPVLLAPPADEPFGLLIMGDGTARRSTTAPGYFDPRAEAFDAGLAAALRTGRGSALGVDQQLGDELLATAPRVWNAARALLPDDEFEPDLLYDAAPYGVGYLVAAWTWRG